MTNQENKAIQFAEKVNELFLGKLDFTELARQATGIILQELPLAAVSVFRIDHRAQEIKPYAYAADVSPAVINCTAPQPFMYFRMPLGRVYENLTENTLNTGQINTSRSLGDFGNRDLSPRWQKILGTKFHIALSIKTKNKVEGVLVCASRHDRLTSDQIALLKIAANRLGSALENVIAHERIIERYAASLVKGKDKIAKIPKIKFTLRLTNEIEQYLSCKVANTKQSKAEYVRKLLKELMANDHEYKQLLEP